MKAELIDHMGSDLTVVNAARVSFDKESEWVWECPHCGDNRDNCWLHDDKCGMDGIAIQGKNVLSTRDQKLISYLATHNHITPFTHPQITLRETVPIFVARQRFKHTVGFTYNEVSRRYVDSPPEFYTPETWRKRAENKKQGSTDESVILTDLGTPIAEAYAAFLSNMENAYKVLLASGVCPEQARMVLPQSMYTSYYVTGSLAGFARAYKLRADPHSQKEIQDLAAIWGEIIQPLFPVSWAALTA